MSRVTIQILHVLNHTNILVVDVLLDDQINSEDEEKNLRIKTYKLKASNLCVKVGRKLGVKIFTYFQNL